MAPLSWEEINRVDIVDFLASIGIHPKYISGNTYVYLSPLHEEKRPHFKVDRTTNRWRDEGTGQGSTLIDFGILYFHCTVGELRDKFNEGALQTTAPALPAYYKNRRNASEHPIDILKTYRISSPYLHRFLWERRIPVEVADLYCQEAQYTFGPKPYYGLAFRNDLGGYELRNKNHTYSTPPKAPTLISHNSPHIAVFVEYIDMLTFVTFFNLPATELPDFLVLNSITLLKQCLALLETYQSRQLYLENNVRGDEYTKMVLDGQPGTVDRRWLYRGYENLNEWACRIGMMKIPGIYDIPRNPSTPSS